MVRHNRPFVASIFMTRVVLIISRFWNESDILKSNTLHFSQWIIVLFKIINSQNGKLDRFSYHNWLSWNFFDTFCVERDKFCNLLITLLENTPFFCNWSDWQVHGMVRGNQRGPGSSAPMAKFPLWVNFSFFAVFRICLVKKFCSTKFA